jgi:hypothetical protein
MLKVRIAVYGFALFVVALFVYGVNKQSEESNAFEKSTRPQYEWKTQPPQTFAIPASGWRSITWPNLPKAKARFTFTASSPVNFESQNCGASMMLSTTIECEIEGGKTEVTIRDSRTQGEILANAGIGAFTRDRSTLSTMAPVTVTFTSTFFMCVRNCLPLR